MSNNQIKNHLIQFLLIPYLKNILNFCQGKTISSIKSLGQGSYGVVFEVEIDGVKFALKTQIVNKEDSFESMEREV